METENRSEIERVVQLYIDGARMFGSLGGTRYDEPIEQLIAMSDGQPADVGGSYKAQIVAMRQVGDAAIVTVEEEGYWGTVSFTDFFALSSIKDEWKIVNKTFVHTGGEPPAM